MPRLQFPLQDQLHGYSKALFSTWLYHSRFGILFDAGEGVSTFLGNRVFGIRRIFLSHGHADHVAGLVNLINIRNLGAGDQTAELKIYYPAGNKLIELVIEYLGKTQKDLSFNLEWVPLEAGVSIRLEDQKSHVTLETFKTKHSQRYLSLGFNVFERRRKLRPECQNLSQHEINEIVWSKGKDAVSENYNKLLFSYGGDSRPINPDYVRNSLFLCHECTYLALEDDDRDFQQHSILHEVLKTAKDAGVETLLLFHVSLRYNLETIRRHVIELKSSMGLKCRILVLYGSSIIDTEAVQSKKRGGR